MVSVKSHGEVEAPINGLYFGGKIPEPSKNVHAWVVEAINTQSGSIRWASTLHEAAPSSTIHVKNTYASETPVSDGKHIYVYFGYMRLYCLDWNGAVVWKHKWPPTAMLLRWGTSSSPILHDQWVIIVKENEEQSWMAAYAKKSGQEQWKVLRDEPCNFSAPFVWENDMRTEIITTGVNKTRSYDLMGQPLWTIRGMSTICNPTPFADEKRLYVAAGCVEDKLRPNKPIYAIRPGASGDITLKEGTHQNQWIEWMVDNAAP